MREQAPGAKLLHDSVSGASSLVCTVKFALRERVSGASSLVYTEICFAGACFRSKLHRMYWLRYLPGSMFRERVSGASFFVCTGWSTYSGASFGSVFQEQAPSCVPAFTPCCNASCHAPSRAGQKFTVNEIHNTSFKKNGRDQGNGLLQRCRPHAT